MDNLNTRLLSVIPSTEPSSFFEVLKYLGSYAPERGDKGAWRDFFKTIRMMEREGLIAIEWDGDKIESLQLTESGATLAREMRRASGL